MADEEDASCALVYTRPHSEQMQYRDEGESIHLTVIRMIKFELLMRRMSQRDPQAIRGINELQEHKNRMRIN